MNEVVEQSRKEIIDDWFDTKFLPIYQNKENVERGRRVLHRWQPTDEILEQIIGWVIEDNRTRRTYRQAGKFYREACNVYSFFNDSRWHDEIPSTTEAKQVQTRSCGCGQKVVWTDGKLELCTKCYDAKFHADDKRKIYDHLCSLGLGKLKDETKQEWIARLRQNARQAFKRIGTVQRRDMAMAPNPHPPSRRTHEAGESVGNDV